MEIVIGGICGNSGINTYIRSQHAETCLFLVPFVFDRMSKTMGFIPKPLCKIIRNKTGRFLAFPCDVI